MWQRSFFVLAALLMVGALQGAVIELTKENVQEIINSKEKPIIIYFYTTHCAACARVAPIFDRVAQEAEDTYLYVKVCATKELIWLARDYGVKSFPYFVVLRNKNVIGLFVGAGLSDEQLKGAITRTINSNYSHPEIQLARRQLQEIIVSGTPQELKQLISTGIDLEIPFEDGTKPLVLALKSIYRNPGNADLGISKLQLLVDAGVSLMFDRPKGGQINLKTWVDKIIAVGSQKTVQNSGQQHRTPKKRSQYHAPRCSSCAGKRARFKPIFPR